MYVRTLPLGGGRHSWTVTVSLLECRFQWLYDQLRKCELYFVFEVWQLVVSHRAGELERCCGGVEGGRPQRPTPHDDPS